MAMVDDDVQTSRREFLRQAGMGMVGLSTSLVGCESEALDEDVQSVELVVQWIDATIDGVPVRMRSYSGSVPGPTIHTRPGQRLEIALINDLDDYEAKSWTRANTWNGDHNVPHMLSHTNLHLHGLDVVPHLFEPLGTAVPSSSMISIDPEGGRYDYVFDIPADHPSGLFWYHPHHHGSTVVQAVSGMAGALIVDGPIDDVPEIAAAKSYVVAIQDIGLFPSDDPATPDLWIYEPVQNAIWQTFGGNVTIYEPATGMRPVDMNLRGGFTTGDYALRFYLVNGEAFYREDHNGSMAACPDGTPTSPTCPIGTQLGEGLVIRAAPGEVIRLRVLNGCSDLVMPLHLEGHDIHLLALDGVNFSEPRTITTQAAALWDGVVDYSSNATSLVLAPANRGEFLVRAGALGSYSLVQLAHQGQQFLASEQKVIATLVIEGEPVDMQLPTELPAPTRYRPLIEESEIVDDGYVVAFSMMFEGPLNPVVGLDFMIGDALYDEHDGGKEVILGTAEQWSIQTTMTEEGHPFHLHVNHFEVMSIAGLAQPPGTIMDTVWVPKPPTSDGSTRAESIVRMRFVEWAGKSVYHCHILPHEDTGMMNNFIITA
jgi:FtsP/CotA-like multicopper oxidase with cupredoxin domain